MRRKIYFPLGNVVQSNYGHRCAEGCSKVGFYEKTLLFLRLQVLVEVPYQPAARI